VKTKATKVEKGDGGVRVTVENGKGEPETIEGDVLLVAIGRRPVTEDMGFEEAGVTLDRGYVTVDEYCRPGPEGLYAVGDILPPYTLGLAHSSFQEGMLVAEHAAGRRSARSTTPGSPASPGPPGGRQRRPHRAGAEGAGRRVRQEAVPLLPQRPRDDDEDRRHVKVLARKDNGPVLGIHIVGPQATDLIAEGQLIYNWEALPTDVAQFIHAHPTLSEAVGEAHLALAGKALHG
jgi:dihydrolipoamide dehydrogenase